MCSESSQELHEWLQQLAQQAQAHQANTKERRLALTKLVEALLKCGKLYRPRSGEFPTDSYEEIYEDACQELMIFICKRIDLYNSTKGSVLNWVNFLMNRRFFNEATARFLRKSKNDIFLDDLPEIPVGDEKPFLSEQVREILELDPDGIFGRTHIRNNPQANFRVICLSRLNGYEWEEISSQLGVKISTLSDFYRRNLPIMGKLIKKCLAEKS